MMFDKIALPFLAAAALQASGAAASPVPEAEDKPVFVRSYEHPSPVVREYRLAGVYGASETPYAVSLQFRRGQWEVQLENGSQPPFSVRLDKAYNRIPMNDIIIATEDGVGRFVVLIPFGRPHSDCFANGDQVFSQLSIRSEGEVRLEHFPKCTFEEIPLPATKSGRMLVVGPPPPR